MVNQTDALRRRAVGLVCAGFTAMPWLSLRAQTKANPEPRLVTLGGGITEVVYLLNAHKWIVGTDTTSVFPDAALRTTKVGYLRALSAEGLLSLRPTAIVTSSEAGPPVVLDQVRQAGVAIEAVNADHTWLEVQRKVQAVGRATGKNADAKALQATLDLSWEAVLTQVAKQRGRKPRVLFILAHGQSPSVSGEGTAANALIGFMGCINAMTAYNGYRPMTAEALAQAAPDVILTSTQGIAAQGGEEKFWNRPELVLTPAFKRKALVHMDASKMLGFGPRMPQAVLELHQKAQAG
jgi:iron complex transport system substrate-binding protein